MTSVSPQGSDLPSTLPALIRQSAQSHGARLAIVDGETRLSYADLLLRSEQVARSLIALGVQAGDRVALWAPNVHEWIVAACGAHAAGAVLVPLNTRMKGAEAVDILARSRAKVLFCIGEFLGQYYPALLAGIRPDTLNHVVVLRGQTRADVRTAQDIDWTGFLALGQAVPREEVLSREAALCADSTADLMFTSGTTGRPKGMMAAHGPTIRARPDHPRLRPMVALRGPGRR